MLKFLFLLNGFTFKIEEQHYYLEELNLKVTVEEETFRNLKKRAEALSSIFNERQGQLMETEMQIGKNMQELAEHEQKLNRLMMRFSTLL